MSISADANLGNVPTPATADSLVLDGGTLATTLDLSLIANGGTLATTANVTLSANRGITLAHPAAPSTSRTPPL